MNAAQPIDRNALAAAMLPRAMSHARIVGRNNRELTEHLRDVATEAVVRALNEFDPSRGQWVAFAFSFVRKRLQTAAGRWLDDRNRRPEVGSIGDEEPADHTAPAGGRVPMSTDLRDLPPDLRDTVRLYYIDRFSQDDIALLCGCSQMEVRRRLKLAAEHLADGETHGTGNRHHRG